MMHDDVIIELDSDLHLVPFYFSLFCQKLAHDFNVATVDINQL